MSVSVIIKWGGQEYSISSLSEEDTVMDLKQSIKSLTGVLPERQKLLGLKVKGKPAEDEVKLGSLKLKPNTKIMMMGTREESLVEVLAPHPENDDVVNDFDIEEEVIEVENREENLAKIARRVKDYKVEELNPPREGKRLLVLDVDYTLFDHKSCAETGQELMRPYLHEFLTSAYEDYDIVIWCKKLLSSSSLLFTALYYRIVIPSIFPWKYLNCTCAVCLAATSMKWIDAKMKELGVTDNPNYKITFMLDSAAMITVHTPKRGVVEVGVGSLPIKKKTSSLECGLLLLFFRDGHIQVKPLGVIWGKYGEFYNRKNTIMFDDIGRNFLMNPQNGLKIRPFMKAHLNREKDRELYKLSQYLKEIAKLEDFSGLNHKHWER
ncbi:unnamed protein product [Tetraodon nigroviridis]|uniref:Ubiquitin-like domain-containing CTD phosphatase 1 n=1 Tax=Tetraodon nigroviridis TaxID=99883 RepID=Q4RRW7_TETNG|nr:unnamed protein product [Tetraodon nigroviridis]